MPQMTHLLNSVPPLFAETKEWGAFQEEAREYEAAGNGSEDDMEAEDDHATVEDGAKDGSVGMTQADAEALDQNDAMAEDGVLDSDAEDPPRKYHSSRSSSPSPVPEQPVAQTFNLEDMRAEAQSLDDLLAAAKMAEEEAAVQANETADGGDGAAVKVKTETVDTEAMSPVLGDIAGRPTRAERGRPTRSTGTVSFLTVDEAINFPTGYIHEALIAVYEKHNLNSTVMWATVKNVRITYMADDLIKVEDACSFTLKPMPLVSKVEFDCVRDDQHLESYVAFSYDKAEVHLLVPAPRVPGEAASLRFISRAIKPSITCRNIGLKRVERFFAAPVLKVVDIAAKKVPVLAIFWGPEQVKSQSLRNAIGHYPCAVIDHLPIDGAPRALDPCFVLGGGRLRQEDDPVTEAFIHFAGIIPLSEKMKTSGPRPDFADVTLPNATLFVGPTIRLMGEGTGGFSKKRLRIMDTAGKAFKDEDDVMADVVEKRPVKIGVFGLQEKMSFVNVQEAAFRDYLFDRTVISQIKAAYDSFELFEPLRKGTGGEAFQALPGWGHGELVYSLASHITNTILAVNVSAISSMMEESFKTKSGDARSNSSIAVWSKKYKSETEVRTAPPFPPPLPPSHFPFL